MTGKSGKSRVVEDICRKENYDILLVHNHHVLFGKFEQTKVIHYMSEEDNGHMVEIVRQLHAEWPFAKLAIYANLPYTSEKDREQTNSVLGMLQELAVQNGSEILITLQDDGSDEVQISGWNAI